ncbi:unnamed protein product [Nezara viridula]|uniref:Uncharacterized protein n=1 Tax=Nezara viridula TaxID=85310 RepID=A0A9P0GZB5_NEZVI|nr:unnamed protein product [Nezara viridula]
MNTFINIKYRTLIYSYGYSNGTNLIIRQRFYFSLFNVSIYSVQLLLPPFLVLVNCSKFSRYVR